MGVLLYNIDYNYDGGGCGGSSSNSSNNYNTFTIITTKLLT